MGVFNKKLGGWTEQAKELSDDINKNIKDVLLKYYNEGMTIEEIAYVVNNTVEEELLFKQRTERLKLDKIEAK
jgi:hypothetical protein